MHDPSLADLIRRAQLRESAAFEAIVSRYGGRVFGFLFRATGLRDEADDLAQEVFLRVVRMIGSYQDDGRFEAWLFRIAANLARDRRRRSRRSGRRVDVSGPEGSGDLDDFAGRPEPPAGGLERAEDSAALSAAMQALPEAEREVILLRHYSDMSFKEIAETMGTPLGTALARAHRGLQRLRELMEHSQGVAATRGEPVAATKRT